ncbi:hypothetical protein KC332_g15978 [Hortaea werneckii]|nr:hypothetical protein KC332_g15978 [Hortaea werneckii]
MDAVKNAIGLGQKTQEGQEPVSGQQGSGAAGEPFDAGNKEGMMLQCRAWGQGTADNRLEPGHGGCELPASYRTLDHDQW